MDDISTLNSAEAVFRARQEQERARLRQEATEASRLQLLVQQNQELAKGNRLLEEQLKLAKSESEQSAKELKKSKRMNWAMFIISVISAGVAIASMIIAIIK